MLPFNDPTVEIRVLRFEEVPVDDSTPLRCSLQNVSLDDRGPRPDIDCFGREVDGRDATIEGTPAETVVHDVPTQNSGCRFAWGDFQTLSYTWGQETSSSETIFINGKESRIPHGLAIALRALACQPETQLGMHYWVDSLCINQNDTLEKNQQVKRMGDIYRKARAVIVWLGPQESGDERAIAKMRQLCQVTPKTSQHPPSQYVYPDAWDELYAFMRKTYWSRTWIIQELAMNHNATLFLCGTIKLTRRMVLMAAVYCQQISRRFKDDLPVVADDDSPELQVWALSSRMHRLVSVSTGSPRRRTLDKLLNLIRRADATDMRDKVYGILGLLDDTVAARIVPDYELSVRQVYVNFAMTLIDTSKRLETIIFGGLSQDDTWPTWVPDWRVQFNRDHVRYLKQARACGDNMIASLEFKGEEQLLLTCSGDNVDTLTRVGATPNRPINKPNEIPRVDRYKERSAIALWRTLLLDDIYKRDEYMEDEPPLLEVPWVEPPDPSDASSPSSTKSEWDQVLRSSNYRDFHEFRQANYDFPIGERNLEDFFPHSVPQARLFGSRRQLVRATLSIKNRTLAVTTSGYLCLVPDAAQEGDILVILAGCRCPMILRPRGSFYAVVGECYAHGLMEGEFYKSGQNCKQRDEFTLC
ncbi:HET-domain-containing protein [Aaosphaeria arxii CBS 175.79]|uniref:HET-domain-containing protein n=1 Tax=Aaosphaeria arxii CBS 175.79 TaxID=1450172 RepID=A0A6A5Y0V2_9PLEO|nr:HET-domain-containing protein [Aaosphaeria arxii CBS 175.79]KAF2019158.1 HET-domain-containing protein [Aaosphaeria arxii CBS 175.79]